MANHEDAREELERLMKEWLAASDKAEYIRRQYISSGAITPGIPIRWPEKVITPEATREIQEAEDEANRAHKSYIEARKRFWQSIKQPA